MKSMRIKICGLTRICEAEYLNKNQVNYVGFVMYYPKSKRNVDAKTAKQIMEKLDSNIQKVAVVVSPTEEQVQEIADTGFDYIQIHGELSEELLEKIKIPIWKAFNVQDMERFEIYRRSEKIVGYLFDASEPGSGKTFDWNILKQIPMDGKLRILAGGLTPDNVQKAIVAVHPDVVDVSSGVEYTDRQGKDPEKIDAFVRQVRNISAGIM